jgi:putative transposase
VIFPTDQGSEYTAGTFRTAGQRLGICQPMGRPGSAHDNAVMEARHFTLESGLRRVQHCGTRAAARARVAVDAWIEEYNTTSRHTATGMMLPTQ